MEMNRQDAKNAKKREPSKELDLLAHEVIGAAIEVHRLLGPGFLESVYHQALRFEFEMRGIPHKFKHPVAVKYKNHQVGEGELDFLVGDLLIVELKAVERLAPIHEAQVMSYLKMTKNSLGLLINFNVPLLKEGIKRIILSS
ncbi:GxxExxY protein [Fischerella thermalis CCMEE 5198]|jgi:GxxExxY protein|uniref:GxxExxY protein n=1 Tax=Fischerella thermalis CCMEE 5268 TaxID=2019662 RepID=A0A2N6KFG5_9CYAN|nr:GxxExxY protein [Fischerella thermalis]PLZ96665.1 GxxExxY protein [Fischerella thermalis CCMEE 5196]PLZ97855.1 GxxExxY protein [Fischerella thermalis CCMEE 5268]PMB20288.1 GxxExxY protein [Fischerella thermalis CCMEE 5198]PMB48145.1 GxxExxY protein [Fischerella thermalis CCMEE 5201]